VSNVCSVLNFRFIINIFRPVNFHESRRPLNLWH